MNIYLLVPNNMIGTIPAELRHLRHLKLLHMNGDKGISGRIPFQLETLNELDDCECVA